MSALQIDKKTESKIQQIKMVIAVLCLLNDIHLSETDMTVLAFYIQYRISHKTDELLVSSKVVKDLDILRNVKSRLYKKGFLKRNKLEYKTYELAMSNDFSLEDNDITLVVKLDNR